VLEDDRAVGVVMLVVGDTRMGVSQELGQRALALFDRRAPQVLAVHFEQIEGAEHGGGVVPVSTDHIEYSEAAVVAYDGLAVDQAGAHRQHCQGGDDLWESVREIIAIGLHRFSGTILVAIGGIADISGGRSKRRR